MRRVPRSVVTLKSTAMPGSSTPRLPRTYSPSVFSREEHPVDVLFGDTHGTAVGVQIQLPAHGHVGALHFAAHGGGGGAFQQHVAGLDLRQNVVGNGLAAGHAVLNGQSLDLPDNDGTRRDLLRQQLFQHTGGLAP